MSSGRTHVCAASFPRICHCEGDEESPLITPCRCTGTLRFVHQSCLHQWIKSSDTRCCELCKYDFIMETKLKPLRKVQCGLWAEQGGEEERAEQTCFQTWLPQPTCECLWGDACPIVDSMGKVQPCLQVNQFILFYIV